MEKALKSAFYQKAMATFAVAILTLSLSGATLAPVQVFGKVYKGKVLGDTTTKPPVVAPAPKVTPPPAPTPPPPPPKPTPKQDDKSPKQPDKKDLTTSPVPTVTAPSAVSSLPAGILKNSSPNTILSLPANGMTGVAVSATAGVGNANNTPFSFLFLWGDGNYIITSVGSNTATHIYSAPGTYTVIMMALLGSNIAGTANGTITIVQGAAPVTPLAAPVVIPGTPPATPQNTPTPTPTPALSVVVLPPDLQVILPSSGIVGQAVSALAQVNNYSSPVDINFSWGNGNFLVSKAGNNNVSYTYSKPGNYPVTVYATVNGTTLSKKVWINIAPATGSK